MRDFDAKWLAGRPRACRREPLIGSADIQSLADLGNAYGNVDGLRLATGFLCGRDPAGRDHPRCPWRHWC